MSWLRSLRLPPAAPPSAPAVSRRQFFAGPAAAFSDTEWDEVEARAARFGITPGTVVDAQGRPVEHSDSAEPGSIPFLGQIMIVGFNFPPRGWTLCDGQLLPINQNQALFSLLGTIYGGDGRTTFQLPDLRGRASFSSGQGGGLSDRQIGEQSGAETHTLTTAQIPSHSHTFPEIQVRGAGTQIPGVSSGENLNTSVPLGGGGGQAHDNMPPFLVLNYCIALQGIFPSRN